MHWPSRRRRRSWISGELAAGFVFVGVAFSDCNRAPTPESQAPRASLGTVTPAPSEAVTSSTDSPPQAEPTPPPAPSPPPPEPPRPDYQQADLDPYNDLLVSPPEPLADCEARLGRAGIKFRPAELPLKQKRGDAFTCGAEQVVTYLGGPASIRYNAPPTLTCRMALALSRFEELAQEEAERHLGRRVTRFEHGGTYNCRKMARFDFVSEHSYANAIDLRTFTLNSGERLSVERRFGALDAPASDARALFLRSLANRAFDEQLFSVVLTPFWDLHHRDHFHLDLARYRVDGSRK